MDTEWKKSSHSNPSGNCVEVRKVPNGVEVRDTKDRTGPVLRFSNEAWKEFTGEE